MPYDIEGALRAGLTLTDVATEMANKAGYDADAARKAGVTDDQIIAEVKPRLEEGMAKKVGRFAYDNLVPGSVKRGVAKSIEGTANTAEVLGAPGAAETIRNGVDQNIVNTPSGQEGVVSGIKNWSPSEVLYNLPSAIGESIPMLGAVAGATAALGPVGGGAVAAGLGAATSGGDIAKARAANDGRATPSAADIALGLGGGAALNVVGNVPGLGATKGLVPGLVAGGKAAIGDAAQAIGQQVLTTAGTEKGVTIDPAEAAANAVTGAATRGALGVARKVGDAVVPETAAQKASRLTEDFNNLSPEQQQQARDTARAAETLRETEANAAPNSTDVRSSAAARTSARDLTRSVTEVLDNLDIPEKNRAAIDAALSEARNSQGVLTEDHLAAVRDAGLDPATTTLLEDTFRQINMLSDAGIARRGGSLLERGGALAGWAVGSAVGATTGHPLVTGRLGSAQGAALGAKLADTLGITQPRLVKDAALATAMLDAVGEKLPNTRTELANAVSQSRDMVAEQARLMGLDKDKYRADAVAERTAKDRAAFEERGRKLTEQAGAWMERQLIQQQRAGSRSAATAAETTAANRAKAASDFNAAAERDQTSLDRSAAQSEATVARQRDLAQAEVQRQNAEARAKAAGTDAAYDGQATTKAAQEDALFRIMEKGQTGESRQASEARTRALKVALDQSRAHFGDQAKQTVESTNAPYAEPNRLAPETAADLLKSTDRSGDIMARREAEQAAADAALAEQFKANAKATGTPAETPVATPGATPPGPPAEAPGAAPRAAGGPETGGTLANPEMGAAALAQAKLLADWKFGVARDVHEDLLRSGMPKNLNYAREVNAAVMALQKRGLFDAEFGAALMAHRGRVLRPFYNLIRNEVLSRHGIDRTETND